MALAPVLSGGCLTVPAPLSTVLVKGRHFVRLVKTDQVLCRFLTGERIAKRPMKDSSTFRAITQLRNEAMMASAMAKSTGDTQDDLGDVAEPLTEWAIRRRENIPGLDQGNIMRISVGGHTMLVLSGHGRETYMEATTANMSILHRMVSTELGAPVVADSSSPEFQAAASSPGTPPVTPLPDSSESPTSSGRTMAGLDLDSLTPEKHIQGFRDMEREGVLRRGLS